VQAEHTFSTVEEAIKPLDQNWLMID